MRLRQVSRTRECTLLQSIMTYNIVTSGSAPIRSRSRLLIVSTAAGIVVNYSVVCHKLVAAVQSVTHTTSLFINLIFSFGSNITQNRFTYRTIVLTFDGFQLEVWKMIDVVLDK